MIILEAITILTIIVALLIFLFRIKTRVVMHFHTQYDEYLKSFIQLKGWFAGLNDLLRGIAAKGLNLLIKFMASVADECICPSAHFAEILKSRNGLKCDITVWEAPVGLPKPDRMGLDFEKLANRPIEELKNSLILLFCGRAGDEKKIRELLTVFRDVYKMRKDSFLFIIGGGEIDHFRLIGEEICGEGINNVVFTGRIEREQMSALYAFLKAIATCICISCVDNETQGLGLLEQMLYGFAAVVLANTILAEFVLLSKGGIVLGDNFDAWGKQIVDLADEPETLALMGHLANVFVGNRFSEEAASRRLHSIVFGT